MISLSKATTLVFDCDGVILDSNSIKTEAFRAAALPYGDVAAQALVDYHIAHGGVSRYVKFSYFLEYIVPRYSARNTGPDMNGLLATYADEVRAGLLSCRIAEGLDALRDATSKARWMIVSGGDQDELRSVFANRGIDKYFDGGIFGSPYTKDAILAREIARENIRRPAVFFGDSRLDHEAATRAELEFVFLSGWSEWDDGKQLATEGKFAMVESLADLLKE